MSYFKLPKLPASVHTGKYMGHNVYTPATSWTPGDFSNHVPEPPSSLALMSELRTRVEVLEKEIERQKSRIAELANVPSCLGGEDKK